VKSLINPEPLSTAALVLNLLLGLGASTVVAFFYALWGEALTNRIKFARLIPMLTMVTVLTISIIKASLALSLGMVGALSIVRFRTAVKDPEELLYLFLAIAIGVGFGADQRVATLIAVGIILVFLIIRRLLAPRARRRNLYVNIAVTGDPDGANDAALFQKVNGVLSTQGRTVEMRRLDRHSGTLQMTYLLDCRDQDTLARLLTELQQQVPGCSFSFVDQNSLPES